MTTTLNSPINTQRTLADTLYQIESNAIMAPVLPAHADAIAQILPGQADFARALVPALTDSLNPPLPILVSLVAMREQLMRGAFGVMQDLRSVRVPLSILVAHEGMLHRYLTPIIAATRQSWLTFNMAGKNRAAWTDVCGDFGVQLLTTCCCSIILIDKGRCHDVLHSDLVRMQDNVRSAADRLATPVHMIDTLDQVPGINSDLTGDERQTFDLMAQLFAACAPVGAKMNPAAVMQDFLQLRTMTFGAA